MAQFTYIVTDPQGIHARPAGELVKQAAAFAGNVKIAANGREVDAKRIMGVMSLGVKQGMDITITCEGDGADEAAAAIEAFLKANL